MDNNKVLRDKFLETNDLDYIHQMLVEYGRAMRKGDIQKNLGVSLDDVIKHGVPSQVVKPNKVYRGYVYQGTFYYKQNGDVKSVDAKKVGAKPSFNTGRKNECAPAGVGTAEISTPSKVDGYSPSGE